MHPLWRPLLTRRALCAQQAPPPLPYRVGHGFDLHRLAPGLKLILGGVDIPHTKGCEAHSDGKRSRASAGQHFTPRRCTDRVAAVLSRLQSSWRCARRDFSTHVLPQPCAYPTPPNAKPERLCCTGDVLIHCIVDSILGALGLPDIGAPGGARRCFLCAELSAPLSAGQLFPDTDPTWKGASSDRFLIEAMRRMREAG